MVGPAGKQAHTIEAMEELIVASVFLHHQRFRDRRHHSHPKLLRQWRLLAVAANWCSSGRNVRNTFPSHHLTIILNCAALILTRCVLRSPTQRPRHHLCADWHNTFRGSDNTPLGRPSPPLTSLKPCCAPSLSLLPIQMPSLA